MRVTSILDTDLYKLSMQAAVLQHFPTSVVEYRFTNRGGTLFSRSCFDAIHSSINNLGSVTLSSEEHSFLANKCPYFTSTYLDYLRMFRFRPLEQVTMEFVPEEQGSDGIERGQIELAIKGLWAETMLYEVPVMALISEVYFSTDEVGSWDYRGQFALAEAKGITLFEAGCVVSEFGTRRRRSYLAQDIVLRGLMAADLERAEKGWEGKLAGTSNVHFAHKHGLAPIGTIAHEWIMGIAAKEGYVGSNSRAMQLWEESYPSGALSVALTDTFTTKPFFDDFVADPVRANRWKGLRQDSGDPFAFIPMAKEAFIKVGADPKTKVIVFSDALSVPRCLELQLATDAAGCSCSFGIGTNLTNDFESVESPVAQEVPGEGEPLKDGVKSKALNMVLKLYQIDGKFCVKISDEITKNTGQSDAVKFVKERFGIGSEP